MVVVVVGVDVKFWSRTNLDHIITLYPVAVLGTTLNVRVVLLVQSLLVVLCFIIH